MNKFTTIFFFALLLIISDISAQTRIYLGPKGGPSVYRGTWLGRHDPNTDKNEYNLGYTGGVCLQIRIRKMFYIQPEVNVTQRGFRMSYHEFTSLKSLEFEYRINTAYVLAKFGFAFNVGDFRGSLFVGPSIGLGVPGRFIRNETTIATGEQEINKGYCGICFTNDYSIVTGIGMSYELGPGSLVLDLQIVPTFSSWFNEKTGYEFIAQYALDASIGYLFRLTKKRAKRKEETPGA